MQSYGLTLLLKDDADVIDRYKRYHREAWPEVIARLKEIGIIEMKIFLIGRRLFMYMEAVDGFDPDRDFPKLNELPRYREWDVLMSSMQERVPEAREGEWWAAMEEVFDLNW
ncbi:MAG: L-rhamnose mutarotase [Chloroflexi bacterium]|nr:MAG: L-rhamnose mutarotase [Chloroflexota bacterium]TME21847.1 MAG: L-rhamnose mutarotase [Chloroflexota bacterium]TMF53059.1 MAG: L-rhamnose mutarotase [Chloroflexota bacterium]TMG31838.1 MAG: L-rhamnose mutarotase [Chloroflexota bacterium]